MFFVELLILGDLEGQVEKCQKSVEKSNRKFLNEQNQKAQLAQKNAELQIQIQQLKAKVNGLNGQLAKAMVKVNDYDRIVAENHNVYQSDDKMRHQMQQIMTQDVMLTKELKLCNQKLYHCQIGQSSCQSQEEQEQDQIKLFGNLATATNQAQNLTKNKKFGMSKTKFHTIANPVSTNNVTSHKNENSVQGNSIVKLAEGINLGNDFVTKTQNSNKFAPEISQKRTIFNIREKD